MGHCAAIPMDVLQWGRAARRGNHFDPPSSSFIRSNSAMRA
jgi:hypothetical protein